MATSFTAAALGAEGLAADVTMLVGNGYTPGPVSYTHLRAHETVLDLVCRLLLEKKKQQHAKYIHTVEIAL